MRLRSRWSRDIGQRIVILLLVLPVAPLFAQSTSGGLVVEQVDIGGAAARTDLQAGDVLTEWRSREGSPIGTASASGSLLSPFDLRRIEIMLAPQAAIDLVVLRDNVERIVQLPPGELGIQTRPAMNDDALTLFTRATDAGSESRMEATEQLAPMLAEDSFENAAWLWLRVDGADEQAQRNATALAERAGPETIAAVLEWQANALDAQGAAGAPAAWRDYVSFLESNGEAGLPLAHGFYMLGSWEGRRGDLDWGASMMAQSLEIRRELAPNSIELAEAMIADGITNALQGDLDGAGEAFAEALATAIARDPSAATVAAAHNALGNVAQRRGDLAAAGMHYAEALRINSALNPGGLNVALSLNNLGIVAEETSDLALAESYYDRALALKRETAPGTMHIPRGIENLAYVAVARGDFTRAADLQRDALALYEELAPGSLVVSTSLKLLGRINHERGDLDASRDYWLRAQDLEGETAPNTLAYTEILDGLSTNAESREQYGAAEGYALQALAIREQVAPASLAVAASFYRMGRLAVTQGATEKAEQQLGDARTLFSRLAPGTAREANALHALGNLYRNTGRDERALEHFKLALDAIEAQRGKLGGTDPVRALFAANYAHLYKDCIDLLLKLGQPQEAFEVLERYRARSLLAMLAERNVDLGESLPEELAARRTTLNTEYDQATAKLQSLSDTADNREAIDELLGQLRELRNQRERLADGIRAAVPRMASVESSLPLSVDAVLALLKPGTTLLSFDIGAQRSSLFALARRPDGGTEFEVLSIAANSASLSEDIAALRLLMQLPNAPAESTKRLAERAHALYQQLIAPAAEFVAGSERLMIIPDGPLHRLAFPALVTQQPTTKERPRYLIEDVALHTVVSATLFGELRSRKATPTSAHGLVAFADPAVADTAANDSTSDATRTNRALESLAPLPHARREAQAIADLYADSSRLLLGDAATEQEAKSLGSDARYIHFASHGVLNQRSPLDSFLLLSPSDGGAAADNGLLQAWEVFEQVRIDADLVTLSACDTGIGTDGGGEGLIGLTRAFHYAGARSVLASLWPVSDRSTERLMTAVYDQLRDGAPVDAALRQAQLDLIRHEPATGLTAMVQRLRGAPPESSLAHPFHWAAFQLAGDPDSSTP